MAKTISKKEALAIDTLAIILGARENGLTVRPEDLSIHYAEIDHELTTREDAMVAGSGSRIQKDVESWLAKIEKPEDVKPDGLGLDEILAGEMLAMIKSIWAYGGQTADQQLLDMGLSSGSRSFAEDDQDLTDDDAYEWYDRYSKALGRAGSDALFVKMQPYILEALDKGLVGLTLAKTLAEEFGRFGSVRADIIARTESSKAFNWGRRWRFDQSPVLAGYRYSAILDRRTTAICNMLHDQSWPIGDPDLDNYTPPNHYRCRSILVPISKYQDHTFRSPAAGWEDDLPSGERKVLNQFKDVTWYPTPKNVRKMDIPVPGAAKPKPAATPKAKKPAAPKKPKADPDALSPAAQAVLSHQEAAAAKSIENFMTLNKAFFDSNPNHTVVKSANEVLTDIKAGKYAGKAFSTEYSQRTGLHTVHEFKRLDKTDVFYRAASGVSAADRDTMLADIRSIASNPRYAGVKFELHKPRASSGASYSAATDVVEYTLNSRRVKTLHHEIGHRIHNTKALYQGTPWGDNLHGQGISINDAAWAKWEKITDPYWTAKRTALGEKMLPADLQRFEYPMNANHYYKKGTKANYHKEMFAESTSVFLEGDAAEIAKVRRTYPGLMEFMETEVFKK